MNKIGKPYKRPAGESEPEQNTLKWWAEQLGTRHYLVAGAAHGLPVNQPFSQAEYEARINLIASMTIGRKGA